MMLHLFSINEWNSSKKPARRQCNILLNAVFTILIYMKKTIDHAIYIKVLSNGTLSYLTVSTDDFLNATINDTEFPEPTRVFEEHFEMKFREGSVLKYLHLQN